MALEPDKKTELIMKGRPQVPEIKKVPPEVRRARTLRRKAAVKPRIEERGVRQKKSQQHLERSIIKPTSGHMSLRPGRHSSKLTKHLRSTHA